MKFGKQLLESAHPAYRNYYLAYRDLKKAIKIITGELVPSDDELAVSSPLIEELLRKRRTNPEAQFTDLLDLELTKVNNFASVQYVALLEEIRSLLRGADSAADSVKSELVAFEEYIRLNYTGFRKAAKKFDKSNQSHASGYFMGRVARSGFMAVDLDKLVLGANLLVLKKFKKTGPVPAITAGVLPEIEEQASSFRRLKYFLRADELLEVEMTLLGPMHAVVGFATPQLHSALNSVDKMVRAFTDPFAMRGANPRVSYTEWAIIFERTDKSYSQYSCRRAKKVATENACGYAEPVFSVRWNEFQQRQNRCSLVKETHPKWQRPEVTSEASLQLELSHKEILDILVGGKVSSSNRHPLLMEFAGFVASGQRPSCVYSYKRSLFRQPDGRVFVGIDQDVRFGSLRGVDSFENFFAKINSVEYHAFLRQRAITIWLHRQEQGLPEYLAGVVGSPGVTEVSAFSKAVHAEAALHVVTETERKVTAGLPQWFVYTLSEDAINFALPASIDELESNTAVTSSPQLKSVGPFDVLPPTAKLVLHDYVSSGVPAAKKVVIERSPILPAAPATGDLNEPLLDRGEHAQSRSSKSLWDQFQYVFFGSVLPQESEPASAKIEPKTFLANERTFLNWSYAAFVISALAVALKALDPTATLECLMLTAVAIATLAWSLNVYRLRTRALLAMKPLETLLVSSTNGATAVALSVAAALSVMWVRRGWNNTS